MPNLWYPVNLGFCPDEASWDRWMAKCRILNFPYPDPEHKGAMFSSISQKTKDFDPFGLVTVGDMSDQSASSVLSVLVHESVHAFQFMCRWMDENEPSSEFEAYGIQAIWKFMEGAFSKTRTWDDGKKDKTSKDHRTPAREIRTRTGKGVSRKR